MNTKGTYAIIGAVVGFFCTYLLCCVLEGGIFLELDSLGLMLLFPGAILGAVVGFACGGKEGSSENAGDFVSKDTRPQDKTAVSELMDYKKLLDSGIITQEEFDQKKEELLKKI